MQWNDIYVAGAAAWLGNKEDVQVAVAEGRYDAAECEEDGYLYIRVAGDETPAEIAVSAGQLAVSRAGIPGEDFDLVAHACVGFQGLDYWATASYIQAETVRGLAASVEVKQASNGGMAALDLTASFISTRPTPSAALITTADKYSLPAFDRYRSDKGIVRADGGSGLVLSRGTSAANVAKLLSTTVIGDALHEGLYRAESWDNFSGANGWPVDLRARRDAYMAKGFDIGAFVEWVTDRQHGVIRTALADAGVESGDVARWIFPNTGLGVVNWNVRKRDFGIEEWMTTYEWGRTVGHIGAGDQFAALAYLLESGAVHAGDKVVLVGAGAGFNFGSAVLEIVAEPEWPSSAA
jgi:3-oxoacyl-[acyl-carrier-protein] synthase-3